jgi:hypothetical protein
MSNVNNANLFADYQKKSIFYGRIAMFLGLITSLIPAAILMFVYGYIPRWSAYLTGLAILIPNMIPGWTTEPTAFFPALGISGSYLGWLTGNMAQCRVPAAVMAREVSGVEDGTPESEYLSTLGVGMSIVVTSVILLAGAIGGASLIAAFPAVMNKALTYILPACYGAVLVTYAIKKPILGVLGLSISLILNGISAPTWAIMVFTVGGTIVLGFVIAAIGGKKTQAPAK